MSKHFDAYVQKICCQQRPPSQRCCFAGDRFSGGCASLFNDDHQTITVRTDCKDVILISSCSANVNGQVLTFETPARLKIPRTAEPIQVSCQGGLVGGAGAHVKSGISAGLWGNFLAGGAVGVVIDLNTGRGFAYPQVTNIAMPICQFL